MTSEKPITTDYKNKNMRVCIMLLAVSICFMEANSYKLEDARHLLKNDCYDQCAESKEVDTINFDTTNRGKGQWHQENGIWKRKRPNSDDDSKRKRIRLDRRLDPDAGIDVLDTFGI